MYKFHHNQLPIDLLDPNFFKRNIQVHSHETRHALDFYIDPTKTRAVLGCRGLWVSRFVEHAVFMKGGIRNGLAAVCIWIFYDLAGSVQNHEGRSGTTT